MKPQEEAQLEQGIDRIVEQAGQFGLNFFQMRYEICPADIIYTFGAYGMPIRFSHWSFGKAFHRMKMEYDYGMSKIYELVINSDPCYAFLLETNSLLQNKLIAAHVLAHCDFFKNNWRFQSTNRKMVWTMAAFAERVRQYEQDHGRQKVERFLDACLAIQEHVDSTPRVRHFRKPEKAESRRSPARCTPYDDLWELDQLVSPDTSREVAATGPANTSLLPKEEHARDLLLFLLERAQDLEDWQKDVLSSIRDESLYFRPQMETKILNEGWASIWHARIMRELDLTPEESVEFAKMHSGVLSPSRFHLNPYHLGFHMFERIEEQYGQAKIFEVREIETDISFIRNYLDEALVEKLDLYLFNKNADRYEVTTDRRQWEQVRDGIVRMITNSGIPYIYAEDYDYQKRGELFIRHGYEGVELDSHYLIQTLPHIYHIWGRPVHLETVEEERTVRYTYNGHDIERKT